MLAVAAMLLPSLVSAQTRNGSAPAEYKDYRDIPGVTEEEIAAIERLKQAGTTLTYGMPLSTECFVNDQGELGGFVPLFCGLLEGLFGVPVVPEIIEPGEVASKLDSREIKLTSELSPSSARLEKYAMTGGLIVRTIRQFRMYGSEKASAVLRERTPRFVFLSGTNTARNIAASTSMRFEALQADNFDEVAAMLGSGDADAYIGNGSSEAAFDQYGLVVGEDFSPLIYFPVALATADPDVAAVISVVQKYLDNGLDRRLIELYDEGNHEYLLHKFATLLTDEERAYIADHLAGDIPVAMEDDNYPICFYNVQDGEYQGIAVDVLRQVSDLTRLHFAPAGDRNVDFYAQLSMLERGDAAMITELLYSDDRAWRFLWAEEPYATDYYALISKSSKEDLMTINQMLFERVGVVYKSAYEELFAKWFPRHPNTISYPSRQAAFDALDRGEIDLIMGSQNMLLSETNYHENPSFKTNLVFSQAYDAKFGFNKSEGTLAGIVSKAQRLVDTEGIAQLWTHKVFDYRVKMTRAQIPYLITIAGLLAGVAALMVALLIKNRNMNRNLEAIVKRRTAELEVQTEAAQAASRAKGEFLARMSHEIRTPLNAIIGMTGIARGSSDLNKIHHSLERVDNASKHLLGVINDILDMSKIEANRFDLTHQEFSFEKMLMNITGVIGFRADEKRQSLVIDLNPNVPAFLFGDELRLSQVITNLLTNAVKFTPEQGVITLRAQKQSEEGTLVTLRIEVADTGIGISEEQKGRLFRSFEQADGSTARKYGGTGLGLAISKRIVELMNGEIWIESELGHGAKFIFTVKLQAAGEVPYAKPTLCISREDVRILAVDDSLETR